MKLSEIELDFLYEKSAELFRDKVKQLGEDYEHDNRCACPDLAYSRDCGYRNLYNLYDMMYKTDCGTYQEMWELEVKAYYLDGWIYADELFDLIIKGGDSK